MKLFYIALALLLFTGSAFAQNGLEFDGSDDYVLTTAVPPTGKGARTVECWIRSYYNKKQHVLVDYGAMSPNGSRFTFNMIDGKLRIEVGGTGVTGNKFIADTSWHHVAVTFDDNATPKYRTYIDGLVEDSFTLTITPNTSASGKLKFGVRNDGVNFYKGAMDEVRVWNYARNHTQIKNNYQKELCDREKGLVAYHKFNQGNAGKNNKSEDESFDLSGRGDDGDLIDFALTGKASNWVEGKALTQGQVTGSDKVSGCGKFKSPSGKKYIKSGKYIDTIKNYMGCDSIITFDVTIIPNPTKTINATSCKTYVSPSGNYAWNSTGTYTDYLNNPNGCDTIVTINLIVSKRSRDTIYVNHCGAYTSPSGKYTYTQSGEYKDTLASVYDCDSIITIYLNQLQTQAQLTETACDSYTSPSGNYIFTKSGIYTDTINNTNNCDSIITINLTINNTTYSTINAFTCNQYISPSGKYVYTKSGVYKDTITNYKGCDSVVTISLINGEQTKNLKITHCGAYTAPSGKLYLKSGIVYDTIPTTKGCDSVLIIDLTIKNNSTNSISLEGCGFVQSPSGRYTYSQSGTYTDTLASQNGCDSIITATVTISNLNEVSILRDDNSTLSASEVGDSYQWYWCEGYVKIEGATAKTFKPETEEMYAVEVISGTCSDTSECYVFLGLDYNTASSTINIYPNPATNRVFIQTEQSLIINSINIIDLQGRIVINKRGNNKSNNLNVSGLQSGIYLIEVNTDNKTFRNQLIIE
ncbi:MAG: LamG-like jellyroll fold domain-containing protein [Bacteroidia bacterium]